MVTVRQAQLLSYILDAQRHGGDPPTYDDLSRSMNVASRSVVHRMVSQLEERGYVERRPGRGGIVVLCVPEGLADRVLPKSSKGLVVLPYRGQVRMDEHADLLVPINGARSVPAGMAADGFHFVVMAIGSGVDGIEEGDLCVLREQHWADEGDVVMVEDERGQRLVRFVAGECTVSAKATGMLRTIA